MRKSASVNMMKHDRSVTYIFYTLSPISTAHSQASHVLRYENIKNKNKFSLTNITNLPSISFLSFHLEKKCFLHVCLWSKLRLYLKTKVINKQVKISFLNPRRTVLRVLKLFQMLKKLTKTWNITCVQDFCVPCCDRTTIRLCRDGGILIEFFIGMFYYG